MSNNPGTVIIDSGTANLASVAAALRRLGVVAEVTADAAVIQKASRVILPGVGSAAAAMRQLQERRLIDVLRQLTQPVLGICLGMQILFEQSAESGGTTCLGLMAGDVALIEAGSGITVPHMGWNNIRLLVRDNPLLRGVDDGAFVYFVHSYAVPVGQATLAVCDYGAPFTAVAGQNNFFGCQFHPERSGEVGAQILKNFLALGV